MNTPLYDVVLALHVASALAGFGATGLTGWYAAALRRDPTGAEAERLRRYFRPGVNWAARALILVPLLGGTLLALQHGQDVGQPYPWIGLALWITATGVASARVWPGERCIQGAIATGEVLARSAGGGVPGPVPAMATNAGKSKIAATCRQVERGAAITSVIFVLALAVMIIQPG